MCGWVFVAMAMIRRVLVLGGLRSCLWPCLVLSKAKVTLTYKGQSAAQVLFMVNECAQICVQRL